MNEPAKKLVLCHCGSPMTLQRSYRRRNRNFYRCERYPSCKGTIGSHPDGSPVGVPGTEADKAARILAHDAIDPIWRNCMSEYREPGKLSNGALLKIARRRVYSWLAYKLGGLTEDECHIGNFDAEQCEAVIRICEGVSYAEIRDWFKSNEGIDGQPISGQHTREPGDKQTAPDSTPAAFQSPELASLIASAIAQRMENQ